MKTCHYIEPGAFITGQDQQQIFSTILGSCISVVMWHQPSRFFAFCHYLIACSAGKLVPESQKGRYGDLILPYFVKLCRQHKIQPRDIQLSVFGGACSQHTLRLAEQFRVGKSNIEYAQDFLQQQGFVIAYQNTGGQIGRKLSFDSATGDCQLFFLQRDTEHES